MRPKTTFVVILLCLASCTFALGQINTVAVSGSTDVDIQRALNTLTPVNLKIVVPAGTYSIAHTITASTSPSDLWIHCEAGATLQATTTLSNGMILFQDVSGAMGNVRVDGCVFDSNSLNAPGVVAIANSVANQGMIEVDHNEFKNSTTQGVLLQTSSSNTTQLLNGGNIHDNICHDFQSGVQNAACFESKNAQGTVYRANYMYKFPAPTGSNCLSGGTAAQCPVFGILCNGDNGCSIDKNVCLYTNVTVPSGSSSAACYKGLFMVGYESDGNTYNGSGDCGNNVCSFAEHCDTCLTSETHDNYFWNANTCVRMEVNQDDNIHDNRCYFPTEQGFIVSTREGQPTNDTVSVNSLINTNNLVQGPNISQLTFTAASPTCPGPTWAGGSSVNVVKLVTASGGANGLLVSQDLGSVQSWITTPVLEICVQSTNALNPAPAPGEPAGSAYLQFVLTDCPTSTNCATTALNTPHTTINFPGMLASTWVPVYGWSDSFALNFSSTNRGVRAWGIKGTSIPGSTTILISVFVRDVPFMRHQIHNNHVVRPGTHAFYLQGALQNLNVDHNICTDPGFSSSGNNFGCIRLDVTQNNSGNYPMQYGQISDNTFTNNGGSQNRRGIDYFVNATNQKISQVRSFHNFFQGSFVNPIYYGGGSGGNGQGITDAYYTTSGTCQLTGTTSFTCTSVFPISGPGAGGGFAAAPPFCVATDNSSAAPVKTTLQTITGGTPCSGTSNPSCAQVLLTGGTGSNANDNVSYECRSQTTE